MNKEIILKTKNLQKYFPIKKNKLFSLEKEFVKANENISLSIYKGETIGIVGESGCGKSTFGRTIIQLTKQTGGSSLYYGDSIFDLMPKYVKKVYKNIRKISKNYDLDLAKIEKLKAEIAQNNESLNPQLKEQYRLDKIEFDNKYYNTFRLIGGLATADDLTVISKILVKRYNLLKAIAKLKQRIHLLEVKAELSNQDFSNKILLLQQQIATKNTSLQLIETELSAIKATLVNKPKYQKYESFYDEGIDLAFLTLKEKRMLRDDLQIIFQDPYSSLDPRMTIGDIIGEGLIIHKVFRSKNSNGYYDYIIDIMEKCGLKAEFYNRYPHEFSGGQRQRIGIARALALKPKFVVCDEAVSALDVSIQSQIINLLQSLKDKFNLTYLFITHDLGVVKHISDRIGVMYFGNLVELATAEELFSNPKHPYTKQLINAIPTLDETETLLDITYDETDYYFAYHDKKEPDPDWHEVSKDHFVACTLKKDTMFEEE